MPEPLLWPSIPRVLRDDSPLDRALRDAAALLVVQVAKRLRDGEDRARLRIGGVEVDGVDLGDWIVKVEKVDG